MKTYVNAYAPVQHSGLLCPVRIAAKACSLLTEPGSKATPAEVRAGYAAYRAAKASIGIDEDYTPRAEDDTPKPPRKNVRPAFGSAVEAARRDAKRARSRIYNAALQARTKAARDAAKEAQENGIHR